MAESKWAEFGLSARPESHWTHSSTPWSCSLPVGRTVRPLTLTYFSLSLDHVTALVSPSDSVQTMVLNYIHQLPHKNCLLYYFYIIFLIYDVWSKVSLVQNGAQRVHPVNKRLSEGVLCKILYLIDRFMGIIWGVMLKWSSAFHLSSHDICLSLLVCVSLTHIPVCFTWSEFSLRPSFTNW